LPHQQHCNSIERDADLSHFATRANSAKDFFMNAPVALTTIVDCVTGLPGSASEIARRN
jgi:hypothetical protein